MSIKLLTAIEALLLVLVCLGDFGFDKPGRFGLSFHHLIILIVSYGGTMALGGFLAIKQKQGRWLLAQVLLLLAGLAAYALANLYMRTETSTAGSAADEAVLGPAADELTVDTAEEFNGAETLPLDTEVAASTYDKEPSLADLGLSEGMLYDQAKAILTGNGWTELPPDEADNTPPPYPDFPEISCGSGRDAICSSGWQRGGESAALIVREKANAQPNAIEVVGIY